MLPSAQDSATSGSGDASWQARWKLLRYRSATGRVTGSRKTPSANSFVGVGDREQKANPLIVLPIEVNWQPRSVSGTRSPVNATDGGRKPYVYVKLAYAWPLPSTP
jgi:hypothetical protein